MKKIIYLTLIVLNSGLLRFYLLWSVPPVQKSLLLQYRYASAFFGLLSVLLIYLIVKKILYNPKLGLAASWVMSILPWTIEQGRIISQVNIAVFIVLAAIYLTQSSKNKLIKLFVILITGLIFYATYPQFWIFSNLKILSSPDFINNLFMLFSPDMWFFRNITFYHGGLRDWGFIYLSLFPVLTIGLYATVISKHKWLILLLVGLGVVTSASPLFPETSEFFLAIPVVSLILATGLYRLFSYLANHGLTFKILSVIYIMIITYEISQLLHFYFVHYPQQITGSIAEIKIPF